MRLSAARTHARPRLSAAATGRQAWHRLGSYRTRLHLHLHAAAHASFARIVLLRFVFLPYLKGPEGLQPIIAGESASKAALFYSGRCILAKERADEEWSVKSRSTYHGAAGISPSSVAPSSGADPSHTSISSISTSRHVPHTHQFEVHVPTIGAAIRESI